jgi:hypothetical protein
MPSFARTLMIVLLTSALAGCSLGGDDSPKTVKGSPSPSTSSTPSPTPSGPEPIESTFFGSHDHDPVASWPDGPVGSLRAWDAGVTWREIETAPGHYDFSRLDAMVDQAEQHDSDVLLVLGQTPTFHATDPAAESFYGAGASSPPEMSAWAAYVHAVAKRYAGRPVVLQVWNEANVSGFWSGTQQEMADLTKAAHDALDGITPRPTLVAPALVTRLSSQRAWIDAFYGTSVDGTPVADFVDVVSLQLYPDANGTPETSMELLTAMRTLLIGHNVRKPIWNTEINYGLTGQEVDPLPERRQVGDVIATYLLNAANGVARVYWYGWDQQSIVGVLLTEPDGTTLTKGGEAFVTVHDWMLDATVTGCEQDAEQTWTCRLDHPDGSRTVYWNSERKVSMTVPEGINRYQRAGSRAHRVTPGAILEISSVPLMTAAGP